MNAINTIEHRGFDINVHIDEFAGNPRKEFDPLGKIICVEHRDFNIGDERESDITVVLWSALEDCGFDTEKLENDESQDEQEFINKFFPELQKLAIVAPIDFYDYGSQCKMSVSGCFDYDSTGIIYISRKEARSEYGRLTKKQVAKIMNCLDGEVREYSAYLNGNTYGYIVEPTNGNKIECEDSCWGFYGDTDYMISEAKSVINHAIKQWKNQAVQDVLDAREHRFNLYIQSFC